MIWVYHLPNTNIGTNRIYFNAFEQIRRVSFYDSKYLDGDLGDEKFQDAFRTDVRALVNESCYRLGGALDPLNAFRKFKIRQKLIDKRGVDSKSTGL